MIEENKGKEWRKKGVKDEEKKAMKEVSKRS